MTQHTELIERLRDPLKNAFMPTRREAAYALEAQAREIAELKAQLAATAKNAFEAMPHDIPRRMKDAICEETGWSGSMVSRMYTEMRKAFTGEPYKANEDLDAALLEVARLREALQKANAEGAHFGLAPIKPSMPDVERSIPKFHVGSVEEALKNVPRNKDPI